MSIETSSIFVQSTPMCRHLCVGTGICGNPGNLQKGPTLIALANFETLHKQKEKAKESCKLPA